MRDNLIHVNPFQLLDILSVKGHQQVNERSEEHTSELQSQR